MTVVSFRNQSLCAVALILCLTGCGKSGPTRPPVHAGKGQVTIDGSAAKTGQVTFSPTKADPKQPAASGRIGADGSFAFNTFGDADGVAEGEYEVALRPDPTLMSAVPAVKPVRVNIKANASGGVDPVTIAFESVQGAKPAASATLIGSGAGAGATPGTRLKRP